MRISIVKSLKEFLYLIYYKNFIYSSSQQFSIVWTNKASLKIYCIHERSKFLDWSIFLILDVVPCSLIAPITINLPATDTYVKASWRMQGCVVITIPIIWAMYAFKCKGLDFKKDFSIKIILKCFLCTFMLFGWCIFYILGWTFSLTSHADIITCSSWLIIFIMTLLTCGVVHKYEIIGYIIYFVGIYFFFTDPYALKVGKSAPSYIGDFFAVLGAIWATLFSYINKYTKSNTHPIILTSYWFVFSALYQFMIFPFLTKSDSFFSLDPKNGAFGWISEPSYFFEVLLTSFVTGLLANIGFFAAFIYFPIEIVNSTLLLEPFIAQIAGILLGQDQIPGCSVLITTPLGVVIKTEKMLINDLLETISKIRKNQFSAISSQLSILHLILGLCALDLLIVFLLYNSFFCLFRSCT